MVKNGEMVKFAWDFSRFTIKNLHHFSPFFTILDMKFWTFSYFISQFFCYEQYMWYTSIWHDFCSSGLYRAINRPIAGSRLLAGLYQTYNIQGNFDNTPFRRCTTRCTIKMLIWNPEVLETFRMQQNVRNVHVYIQVVKQHMGLNAYFSRKSRKTVFTRKNGWNFANVINQLHKIVEVFWMCQNVCKCHKFIYWSDLYW